MFTFTYKWSRAYKACQEMMGGFKNPEFETDFQSSRLRRWLNLRKAGLNDTALDNFQRASGCVSCGETGCMEEGPCGGAMCMIYCHACGLQSYGFTHRIKKGTYYAAKISFFYGEKRQASGVWNR